MKHNLALGPDHTLTRFNSWGIYASESHLTIFEIQTEPVESRVEIPSIQHTAFHGLFNVLRLEVELLQSGVKVL